MSSMNKSIGMFLTFLLVVVTGCSVKYQETRKPTAEVDAPIVEPAKPNRLQVVGQLHMSIGYAYNKGRVYLIKDTETEETYLVGFTTTGFVTFERSSQTVPVGIKQ